MNDREFNCACEDEAGDNPFCRDHNPKATHANKTGESEAMTLEVAKRILKLSADPMRFRNSCFNRVDLRLARTFIDAHAAGSLQMRERAAKAVSCVCEVESYVELKQCNESLGQQIRALPLDAYTSTQGQS